VIECQASIDRASSSLKARAGGFTLIELLVVISVIALLTSIVLFAMAGAQEAARRDRTRGQIARIHALLAERWESYLTRRVPLPPLRDQNITGIWRVNAVREMMRMELPDRKNDLLREAVELPQVPALWYAYRRKVETLVQRHTPNANWQVAWSSDNEGAECLYLILSRLSEGDETALSFFSEKEIGDLDDDGVPEILDAWGSPIKFIRWAPGFGEKDLNQDGTPENLVAAGGVQDRGSPDPFDPRRIYANEGTFALFPLIYSAGPDKLYEIYNPGNLDYTDSNPPNNPPNNPYLRVGGYSEFGPPLGPLGKWQDANDDGRDNSVDNIHNHLLVAGS
jgi:prepilin-type N-terminal cleavage/methylation domain-containing protein